MTPVVPSGKGYTAAVVTFRRPDSLAAVLESLRAQSAAPGLTVVADNDPVESGRPVVDRARADWLGELLYVPVGENLGPAGGWARAVDVAARRQGRGDWVLVLDDDDPLQSPRVVEALLAQGYRFPATVAAIGLRGARWHGARHRLVRADPPEGATAPVDYLAGNGAPLYSWQALDSVGFFEPLLFFGFEDLDLGFRLRRDGWDLLVAPHPSLHIVPDTSGHRSEWREYYKTRALMHILRRHRGPVSVIVTSLRSVVMGGLRLAVVDQRPPLARARLSGAWDGYRGRLGVRRYSPETNPPKSALREAHR